MTAAIAFALAALAVVLLARWASDRLGIPFTVLLTVIGGIYALLPGPNLLLEPHVVLTLIIPPLLYDAALEASLLDIRRYRRPIISLSVGLVLATALVTGSLLCLVVGGLGFAGAVALGAAIAPPDPVAALSIGRRANVPGRLITVIEGEGLLNDATALTTLEVAIASLAGGKFSLGFAAGDFVLSAVGGVVVGAVIWLVLHFVLRPVRGDALIVNAVSLATPFLTYLVGEKAHVSGVLAVVVAGLLAGHSAPRTQTGAGRLQLSAVWRLVTFLLEGLVFLLIGQQLPEVLSGLSNYSVGTVVASAGVSLGTVLLMRPFWLAVTQLMSRRFALTVARRGMNFREVRFSGREILALSWAGTRGVITLAAAYSLPRTLPQRDLLLFCAFVVVAVTLLGQGLTFAPLVRRLGVRARAADGVRQRNEARLAAVEAAEGRLADIEDIDDSVRAGLGTGLDELRRRFQHRLESVAADGDDGSINVSDDYLAAVRARRAILEAQREELLRWRQLGRLSEGDLRRLQRELDHEESTLPDVH